MEKNTVEQKCPNCGSALSYDIESGKLKCASCGSTFDFDASSSIEFKGFDFNKVRDSYIDNDSENLPIYACESCGAEIIARKEEVSLTCPYCRNNIVLTDKVSGNMRPNGIVPFKIESNKIPSLVDNFYKNKALLPKRFFSSLKMGKITGIYVPFWVFKGNLAGVLDYQGERKHSHREGDYIIHETEIYDLSRDVSMDFKDLPVDASERINDDLMDSVEPFDMSDVKPFDMGYMAGYAADRFDVEKENIVSRAKRRMFNSAYRTAASEASRTYTSVRLTHGELKADVDCEYILLPVYLFDIEYENEKYSFAVNGQTGKVVGRLPISKGKSVGFFFKRFFICLLITILAFIIVFLLGGL